jgi:hypothetical protein
MLVQCQPSHVSTMSTLICVYIVNPYMLVQCQPSHVSTMLTLTC